MNNSTTPSSTSAGSRTTPVAPRRKASGKPSTTAIAAVVIVGTAAIGGALWWRHRVTSSQSYKLQAALNNPRVKQMQAQFDSLQAQIDRDPNNTKLRWRLAGMFRDVGALDMAKGQLEAIHRIDPSDEQATLALGNVYLATLDADKAES